MFGRGEKKRVLIIDDEEDFAETVKLNLEKTHRYQVQVETQGAQGAASARAFKPDVILLDVIMPDKPGGEVAREIQDDPATKDIPIVFLTATVMKEETQGGGGMIGGKHFIAKPASTEDIVNCLNKL